MTDTQLAGLALVWPGVRSRIHAYRMGSPEFSSLRLINDPAQRGAAARRWPVGMDFDIIIVGAGPAGLAFARALAGSGLSFAIVERQEQPAAGRTGL